MVRVFLGPSHLISGCAFLDAWGGELVAEEPQISPAWVLPVLPGVAKAHHLHQRSHVRHAESVEGLRSLRNGLLGSQHLKSGKNKKHGN
eukprot:2565751-Amphidinium_carterae.1